MKLMPCLCNQFFVLHGFISLKLLLLYIRDLLDFYCTIHDNAEKFYFLNYFIFKLIITGDINFINNVNIH